MGEGNWAVEGKEVRGGYFYRILAIPKRTNKTTILTVKRNMLRTGHSGKIIYRFLLALSTRIRILVLLSAPP